MDNFESWQTKSDNLHFLKSRSFNDFLVYVFHQFEVPPKQRLKVLQLGAGENHLRELEDEYLLDLYFLDKNEVQLNSLVCSNERDYFHTVHKDILNLELEQKFDIVIDAHCMHCLKDKDERIKANLNIKQCLRPGGLFISEMMVSHSRMSFSPEFEYNNEKLMDKQSGQHLRLISSSLDIERELIGLTYNILFLKIYENLNFIISKEDRLTTPWDPQVLRLVAKKGF